MISHELLEISFSQAATKIFGSQPHPGTAEQQIANPYPAKQLFFFTGIHPHWPPSFPIAPSGHGMLNGTRNIYR